MTRLLKLFARQDAAMIEDEDDNRRRHNRHKVEAEVIVTVDAERYECRLSDVGPGGAFLSPNFDVEIGSQITLQLPNSKITAVAEVRRIEIAGIGIAFDEEGTGAIVASWTRGLIN